MKGMAAKDCGVVRIELHQRIEPLLRHLAHVRRPIGGEDQLLRIDVAETDEAERLAMAAAGIGAVHQPALAVHEMVQVVPGAVRASDGSCRG